MVTSSTPSSSSADSAGRFARLALEDAGAAGVASASPLGKLVGAGVSFGRGGLIDSVAESWGVRGASVVLIRATDGLCLGCVGTGKTKFCVEIKGKCTVAGHRTRKMDNVESGVYLRERNQVVFRNPTVKLELLSDEVLQDLLVREMTLDAGIDEFALLNARGTTVTLEEKEGLKGDLVKALMYTPFKKRVKHEESGISPFRLGETGSPFKPAYQPDPGAATDKFSALFGNCCVSLQDVASITDGFASTLAESEDSLSLDNFTLMIKRVMELLGEIKNYLSSQGAVLDEQKLELENKLEGAIASFLQIKQLQASIGKPNSVLTDNKVEPIVWDAIASLFSQMVDNFEDLKRQMVLSSDYFSDNSKLDQLLGSYKQWIERGERERNDIHKRLAKLETNSGATTVDKAHRLSGLALGIGESPDSKPGSMVGSNTLAADSGGASNNTSSSPSQMKALTDRLTELEKTIKAQDTAKTSRDTVRVGGTTFTCQEDVEAWYIANGPDSHLVPKCGLFVCPMVLYQWIYAHLMSSSSSQTEMLTLKKMEMEEAEMRAIESLGIQVPWIFGKTTSVSQTLSVKSRMKEIPKYEDFDEPLQEQGLKQNLERALEDIVTALQHSIEERYVDHPVIRSVASEMLLLSKDFIYSVNKFMIETFRQLRVQDFGTDERVWNLVTYTVSNIFVSEFAKKRNLAVSGITPNERKSAFKVMWCAFRSVGLAKHLISTGIKDTPGVSASYTKFMLTQSHTGKIAALATENKELKSNIKSLREEIAKLTKSVAEARKVADAAMSKAGAKKKDNKRKVDDDP